MAYFGSLPFYFLEVKGKDGFTCLRILKSRQWRKIPNTITNDFSLIKGTFYDRSKTQYSSSSGSYFCAVQVSSHDGTSRAMIRSTDVVML
jgi:hypothetical protein